MSRTHSRSEIQSRIPHRPPMLLVDEIVEQNDNSILCRKNFEADAFYVQGHFPGNPLVPGVILCECALQSGALLVSGKTAATGTIPVATRLDGVKFKAMVRPGDTVDIFVQLNEVVSTAYFMTGKIMLDGKLAARLDFACALTEPLPQQDSE